MITIPDERMKESDEISLEPLRNQAYKARAEALNSLKGSIEKLHELYNLHQELRDSGDKKLVALSEVITKDSAFNSCMKYYRSLLKAKI